jgi:PKD repeat protein
MCSDGYTWKHRQVCRNNAWVDEYQQCPTPPTTPLTVWISADPRSGSVPLRVSFHSTVSGGAPPYWYSWSFGDASSSNDANPDHTYLNEGNYKAILVVTDSMKNRASSSSIEIVVGAPVSWQRKVTNLYEQPLPKLVHWIIKMLKEKRVQPFPPQYVNAQIDITLSTGEDVDYVKIVTDQEFCGVIAGGSTQSQKQEGFAGKIADNQYRAIITCLHMSFDDYVDLALYVMGKLGVPEDVARFFLEKILGISTEGNEARLPTEPPVHADVEVSVAGVLYKQPEREPPLPTISDVAKSGTTSGASSTAGSIIVGASPIAIMILDPEGRRVGALCENGQFAGEVNEISGAYYSGYDSEPQMILVQGSSSPTSVIVCGKDSGEYTLVAASYISGNGAYQSVTGSIESGQVNAYAVETSSDRTKMQIRRTDSSSGQQNIVLTLVSAVVTATIVLVSSEILLRRQRHRRRRN